VTVPAVQWRFDTIQEDAAGFGAGGRHRRAPEGETPARAADPADAALLAQLLHGDERALEMVFDQYLTPLVRFADATLGVHSGPAGAAGDVVSEVLVSLWTRRATLGAVKNLRAYLYRAVRNRALNHRRAELRGTRRFAGVAEEEMAGTSGGQIGADEQLERDEQARIVWNVVRTMREPLRTIAILRWSHGMGFAEIGAIVGTSEGAARVHAGRALVILRETVPELLR
jgi:RNA polymerase sigma-70 factor (ECF subfamily)